MHSYPSATGPALFVESFHATLRAFPIACFPLALLNDIAYLRTEHLLWLHFSEWLLLAGTAFAGFALLAAGIDFLIRRVRPSWLAVLGGVVVLILGILNNFVHTGDGWTAVMPWGLTLSILTVLAMLVTGWLATKGARHV